MLFKSQCLYVFILKLRFEMDFVTEIHLEKYDAIISNIEACFEENKRLKNILENEESKIFLQNLKNNNMISKLSQVNVKIFRNVMEIYYLYEKDIISCESLKMHSNSKFYLIEIYLTKLLLQKLRHIKWSLLITIFHENGHTSKVINAINKISVLDVITLDDSIINCVLETDLILELEDQLVIIKLDKIDIDISYHFSTCLYKKNQLNRMHQLINITKLYNTNINIDKCFLPELHYELKLDVEKQGFMKAFMKNCYHSLNLDIFEELVNENVNKVEFTLFYGQQQKYSITFSKHNIIICANYADLYLLKKYFYRIFHNHNKQRNYQELNTVKVRFLKFYFINTNHFILLLLPQEYTFSLI